MRSRRGSAMSAPPDRRHLAFAPGEGARELSGTLGEPGQQPEDPRQGAARRTLPAPGVGAEHQVLPHGHLRPDTTALRHVSDPCLHDLRGPGRFQRAVAEAHLAPASAGEIPLIARSRVVLPAPFAPSRATTSRGSTVRLTPRSASIPPRRTRRPRDLEECSSACFFPAGGPTQIGLDHVRIPRHIGGTGLRRSWPRGRAPGSGRRCP